MMNCNVQRVCSRKCSAQTARSYVRARRSIPSHHHNTALGAVFGAFIGDACGATLEFGGHGVFVNSLRFVNFFLEAVLKYFCRFLFRRANLESVLIPLHFSIGNKDWAVSRALDMAGILVSTTNSQFSRKRHAQYRTWSNNRRWRINH